jgi:hypothetical protein
MTEPRPSITRFVDAAARAERARDGAMPANPVAERLLAQLYRQLGKLIGTAGFDALLRRSLVLARRTRPALLGITSAAGGKLEGLDADVPERAGLDEDALTIVAQFIELLATLIGEELAMRVLRELWPATSNRKES